MGKRLGLPVHRIWGLDAANAPQSSFTIAIAESHELERRVAEAREYPILKVKLGTDRDMEIVRIVRSAAPEMEAILKIIARENLVLATGHVHPEGSRLPRPVRRVGLHAMPPDGAVRSAGLEASPARGWSPPACPTR